MNVSVSDKGACRKVMTIEIPVETIKSEQDQTLKTYAKHASIPGFRKGKAPKLVIAKRFEKEMQQDIQERMVPRFYQEALQETELKVVNVIHVSEATLEPEKPFSFEVTVDVSPEFSLPKYTGISVKETKEEVTDEMVQQEVDAILKQHADFNDNDERTIEADDLAQVKYTATIDDKPLEELFPQAKGLGKGDDYWVSADEHAFLPGMGLALIGLKKGDTKEVEITFPEGFALNDLSKKTALYQVEVTAVRERVLPEIDDELLGKLKIESEEQLRNMIRDELEKATTSKARHEKFDQIIKHLIKKTKLEVPESVLDEQTRNELYNIARQRAYAGLPAETIGDEEKEDIKEKAKEQARENVKARYIGLAIANEQNFDALENEINERIAQIAIQQRRDLREVRAELEENNSIVGVAEQIRFDKALDYVLENAKIK